MFDLFSNQEYHTVMKLTHSEYLRLSPEDRAAYLELHGESYEPIKSFTPPAMTAEPPPKPQTRNRLKEQNPSDDMKLQLRENTSYRDLRLLINGTAILNWLGCAYVIFDGFQTLQLDGHFNQTIGAEEIGAGFLGVFWVLMIKEFAQMAVDIGDRMLMPKR